MRSVVNEATNVRLLCAAKVTEETNQLPETNHEPDANHVTNSLLTNWLSEFAQPEISRFINILDQFQSSSDVVVFQLQ